MRVVVASLVLLVALSSAAPFFQYVCQDAGCSIGCVQTQYQQNTCYGTLVSGSSVIVQCRNDNTVVDQIIFESSSNCSGFNYDRKIPVGDCVEGQYAFIDYICGNDEHQKLRSGVLDIAGVQQQSTVHLPISMMVAPVLRGPGARRSSVSIDGNSSVFVPEAMVPAHPYAEELLVEVEAMTNVSGKEGSRLLLQRTVQTKQFMERTKMKAVIGYKISQFIVKQHIHDAVHRISEDEHVRGAITHLKLTASVPLHGEQMMKLFVVKSAVALKDKLSF